MGRVKNHYWEEIMSNQENDKFDELVREGEIEQRHQNQLQGGDEWEFIGNCWHCGQRVHAEISGQDEPDYIYIWDQGEQRLLCQESCKPEEDK
jgi:hypothetical protein